MLILEPSDSLLIILKICCKFPRVKWLSWTIYLAGWMIGYIETSLPSIFRSFLSIMYERLPHAWSELHFLFFARFLLLFWRSWIDQIRPFVPLYGYIDIDLLAMRKVCLHLSKFPQEAYIPESLFYLIFVLRWLSLYSQLLSSRFLRQWAT